MLRQTEEIPEEEESLRGANSVNAATPRGTVSVLRIVTPKEIQQRSRGSDVTSLEELRSSLLLK